MARYKQTRVSKKSGKNAYGTTIYEKDVII